MASRFADDSTGGCSSTAGGAASCVSEDAPPNTEFRSTPDGTADSSSTAADSCEGPPVPKISSTLTDVSRDGFFSSVCSAVSLLPNTELRSIPGASGAAVSSVSVCLFGSEEEPVPNIAPRSGDSVGVSPAVSLLNTPESGFSPTGVASFCCDPPKIEAKSTAGFSCFFCSSWFIPIESRRSSTPGIFFFSPIPIVFRSSSIPSEES